MCKRFRSTSLVSSSAFHAERRIERLLHGRLDGCGVARRELLDHVSRVR